MHAFPQLSKSAFSATTEKSVPSIGAAPTIPPAVTAVSPDPDASMALSLITQAPFYSAAL